MKSVSAFLYVALFMMCSGGMVYGQQVGTHSGEIKGVLIEEKTSRPAVGETLSLLGYDLKTLSITPSGSFAKFTFFGNETTDDAGKFSFKNLPGTTSYQIRPGNAMFSGDTISSGSHRTEEIILKAGESLDLGIILLQRGR